MPVLLDVSTLACTIDGEEASPLFALFVNELKSLPVGVALLLISATSFSTVKSTDGNKVGSVVVGSNVDG